MNSDRVRPTPLSWLWYAFGGGLPARNRGWVLYDTTCSTWLPRHLFRSTLMLAVPVLGVLLFLPADLGLRFLTAFTAGACGLMFMVVHVIETTERRLVKAGYVGGTGELTRSARSHDSQRLANARRRQRVADRAARRR